MNTAKPLRALSRFIYSFLLYCRAVLPRQKCNAFAHSSDAKQAGIGPIYVINLERQPNRWKNVLRELSCVLDSDGNPLSERAIRYDACDAQSNTETLLNKEEVDPFYTLGDQLFVEPQPDAIPDAFDLTRPIRMSREEVAVARSHISLWRAIAKSPASYALVLEDDVCVDCCFGKVTEQAWREMEVMDGAAPRFDVLYVSYNEVRFGAPKELISRNVFRPERGLWFLSGYVLSKQGAQALLELLPCRGPIDLWINHKFREIDVRALRRSVINQRLDTPSTNSHSILPALTRIGVLDYGDTALFNGRPHHVPVFAFGAPGSGLSSLAMALLMLGYRCCSDLDQIPECELQKLVAGNGDRVFNAYVNIASLTSHARELVLRYPHAKFIVISNVEDSADQCGEAFLDALNGADVVCLGGDDARSWHALCEHLRLAPPAAPYPVVREIGVRRCRSATIDASTTSRVRQLRYDRSPWIAKGGATWLGILAVDSKDQPEVTSKMSFEDDLANLESSRWILRTDTFPGNLGLFRPENVASHADGGLSLKVANEALGVRNLSAAAISSRDKFLFGRFEACLKATDVSGLVTGFFLHRDSPRQEIDIEIAGNRPSRLLVNVFYNPGSDGARYDYGYRGTPAAISLWFDASKDFHRYAIEWEPCEIRWFVDSELVCRRAVWNPTPIPHLPMRLHVNTWPTRSREVAGRVARRSLPVSAIVRSIAIDASSTDA